MSKCLFTIAGAILALTAHPAFAQLEPASRTVAVGDLDLSSEAGRIALDRRIGAAVREVCGQAWPTDLQTVQQVRDCRTDTYAAVMADRGMARVYVARATPTARAANPSAAEARMR